MLTQPVSDNETGINKNALPLCCLLTSASHTHTLMMVVDDDDDDDHAHLLPDLPQYGRIARSQNRSALVDRVQFQKTAMKVGARARGPTTCPKLVNLVATATTTHHHHLAGV